MNTTVAGTMKRAFARSSALNSSRAAIRSQSATSTSSAAVRSCAGFGAPRPSGATSVLEPDSGVRSVFTGGLASKERLDGGDGRRGFVEHEVPAVEQLHLGAR